MSSDGEMLTVSGLATARGLASGPVFLYAGDGELTVPEYVVAEAQVEEELARLQRARAEVRRDLESLIAVLKERTGRDDVMVFECHLMILEDPLLVEATVRAVREQHLNAEAALRRTADESRAKFERMNDDYFRERVRDLDDVERRLMKSLLGFAKSPALELKSPAIVVAGSLSPSETMQLPREYVLGFATDGGSTTSHVALLARALGIPAVTGLGDITARVKPGMEVLLDGTAGTLTLNPDAAARADFAALAAHQREVAAAPAALTAGTLRDGSRVEFGANFHEGIPVEGVRECGATGIGLYRSEYLWLNRELEPTEAEQLSAYRAAAELAAALAPDGAVTIRALDIGGDKTVRGISVREANPFLGNRSIRYLLSHREVLRTQLRAILRASAFGKVRLMYPLVSCVEELAEAATALEAVKRELDAEGVAHDRSLPVGAMIEVPAAALNVAAIVRRVDFLSIGTNDLIQYVMAADRGNEAVAHLYQPAHPAVLELVRRVIAAAKAAGKGVEVCGESAADPVYGVLWAAMGAEALSMSAMYIPPLAKIFSRLTRADLDAYAAMVAEIGSDVPAAAIAERCRGWLSAKIPDLEELLI